MDVHNKYITKSESSSPTVSFYTLMRLCVMDIIDKRKVTTFDISSAFLQGDLPQDKHSEYIIFKDTMVDMI